MKAKEDAVTVKELLSRQNMPLSYKVQFSLIRIRERYEQLVLPFMNEMAVCWKKR